MSYEKQMLQQLRMPSRPEVENALLKSLFKHNGVIKEFGAGEEIVEEIANDFNLSEEQRAAYLETVYKKENRVKKSFLWHRLLFRAADSLAKKKLISRPNQTILLTSKKEWMLTEEGYDLVLQLLKIPLSQKEFLPVKSYEVQKVIQKFKDQERPENYTPFEKIKKTKILTQEAKIRSRGFRQAVIEAYDFRCAVCGMKICSPNTLQWEVEAAHIVPHSSNGKDDLFNGLALCRIHHWAFDVGWFSLQDNYQIIASGKIRKLPHDYGKIWNFNFMERLTREALTIFLPTVPNLYPHIQALIWHRKNVFHP